MKRLSPASVGALREALGHIYWYKDDLQRFLRQVCDNADHSFIAQLDWTQTKIQVVADLVDAMTRGGTRHQEALLRMMLAVCDFEDFSHLRRLDDGEEKAQKAVAAVRAVRSQTKTYREQIAATEKAEQRRQIAQRKAESQRAVTEKLDELRAEFTRLAQGMEITPQKRGLEFEKLLTQLFLLFDLDPRKPFTTEADQIDGAFSFDGGDYLLSARWTKDPVGIEDLGAFKDKVQSRLENTLGVYVSVTGFSATAVQRQNAANPAMFLVDAADLMAVLEGRVTLNELLLRKRRHAAQTGEVLLPITDLLS